MKSEEFLSRVYEAKSCEGCLDWHKHCKAECCKIVFLNNVDPSSLERPGKYITMKLHTMDMWRYYRLRDVGWVHGLLRFRKDRIIVVGRQLMYVHPCEWLDENMLCKGHPDRKPNICKKLNLSTSKMHNKGYRVTDNCLFKYKLLEVNHED